MRRKIVNILTGASTVAFVVIAIVWGHSIDRWSNVEYDSGSRRMEVIISCGTIDATMISDLQPWARMLPWRSWEWGSRLLGVSSQQSLTQRLGLVGCRYGVGELDLKRERDRDWVLFDGNGWNLTIPLWPLCLATAILPTVRLVRWQRHRRRRQAGTCPTCGYDLRATPDRCPECGTTTTPTLHSQT